MMLSSPKNLIWPSFSWTICRNIRRQPDGEMNGIRPSMTSTSAQASQKVSLSTRAVQNYFFAGLSAPAPLPRKALKKSDDDGSTTMTSLFLLKLALYASRLR